MAGICLGVLYGGKTAIGVNPIGTRVKAVARIEGFAAPAPTAEGVAPPPPDPGEALPKKQVFWISIYFELDKAVHHIGSPSPNS